MRPGKLPLAAATGLALIGLPLLIAFGVFAVAQAPEGHQGRVLVVFQDRPDDTTAFHRIARAGARPIRLIGAIDGWIAEAEAPDTIARLHRQSAARFVFRDIGLGRVLAGCLALASGPAHPGRPMP